MERTHVRWPGVVALMVAAGMAVTMVGSRARAGPPDPPRIHVVRAGETVWEIAREVVGPTGDPRPVADQLILRNGLREALIRPGDRLEIPAG